MSELDTLIRLHRWQLDEKRRALADLQALADRLEEDKARLEAEVSREQEAARNSADVAFSYAGFAQVAIERRRRLEQSVAQIHAQIAVATDEVADAFQELKRYELAQEGRDRRERQRRSRREGILLDEVAVTGYLRRRPDAQG
ncbi:flagellar FliJ family protein [Arenibaculum sp.]|jgi:flagellar export protein FliJ|uniref:flagellar FliJ family protein n=1 Tax=Arenibaculum sp. TaxID=2865862 RepID=UPI002E117C0E|nr:flagellar FliJ family protein [Arenibaculum sp.]